MNIPLDQEPLTKIDHIEDPSLRVIERFKQKKIEIKHPSVFCIFYI